MLEFLKKMLGGGNDAQLKKLQKPVDDVMALEEAYKKLTDEQLRAKTDEFRARLQKGWKRAVRCAVAWAAEESGDESMGQE
jgi:preprotein translocase subunit SecA